MLLSKIFNSLTHGELSEIKIGGADTHGIIANDYPRIINIINMGLVELYTRFPLNTREITLQLYEQITIYNLTSDYAESNIISTQPIKYILDADPVSNFTDDILLIKHVYEETGNEFPLNDLDAELSVFTPTPTTLQVIFPSNGDENTISIIYRAAPVDIPLTITDPDSVEVQLPIQYLEALTSYVAYKIINPRSNGAEGAGEFTGYNAKFESIVQNIKTLGIVNLDNTQNQKLEKNGWL